MISRDRLEQERRRAELCETATFPGWFVRDLLDMALAASPDRIIDIVFDGPPGPEAGRFVEVENLDGESINVGNWVHRTDGYWALRLVAHHD